MDLKSTYNQIAQEWFEQYKDELWWVQKISDLTSFLQPGASILDVGCGPGITAKYLAQKGFDVTGIDFSEAMIDIAKQQVPQAKFFVMDAYNLPQIRETFGGIVAQAILLHFPKKEVPGILQTIKDRLKPGGYLYIAVKEVGDDGREEKILKTGAKNHEHERFMSYYTMDELKKYLADLKMKIVHEQVVPKQQGLHDNWLRVIARS